MPAPGATATRLIADGGRVLGVTALGVDIAAARARAYAAIDRIDWPEGSAAATSAQTLQPYADQRPALRNPAPPASNHQGRMEPG